MALFDDLLARGPVGLALVVLWLVLVAGGIIGQGFFD